VPLRSRAALLAEFLALFLVQPLALFFLPARIPPIPLLWAWCLFCLVLLYRDPTFPRRQLWNTAPLRAQLPSILILFVIAAALTAFAVIHFAPQTLFDMPRTHTRLWAAVIIFYPILSVWPQGVIYRIFILHRYQQLLQMKAQDHPAATWPLTLLSATAFSLMHIVFHNWIAVALTFPGGILFARRCQSTRSHPVSCFEHALYGCFLFTIGLGSYFYVRFV
jgi:uncharacterized protein